MARLCSHQPLGEKQEMEVKYKKKVTQVSGFFFPMMLYRKKEKKKHPSSYLLFSARQVNSLTMFGIIGSAHKGRLLTKGKLEGKEAPFSSDGVSGVFTVWLHVTM